jgi:membrane protein insertase Oxa1/YidC/SpoIIIJ
VAGIIYTICIYPLEQLFEAVFVFARLTFKATGPAVLFISAAVSVLCLPLYNTAEYWQEKERDVQKRLKPKLDRIRAVFKGDERYMLTSAYYRQNHYHPVYALRSASGLLIQVPFFIAAYNFLSHCEALKGASFLFLSDLSAPDGLFVSGGFRLNLLPLFMTAVNCAAGMVYTRGFPLKEKLRLYGMALVFLVLLYNSPSGLVMYWLGNNVFSLLKNCYDKINGDIKKTVLRRLLSLACFGMFYYVLFHHRGNPNVRRVFAVMLVFAGIVPWAAPAVIKRLRSIKRAAYTNKQLSVLFILACSVLTIAAGFFLPAMLIASSPQEFSYIDNHPPEYFIFNTFLQALGLFLFWPLCLFFLNKKKYVFALVVPAALFAALCGLFFFPGNYGTLTIDMVFSDGVGHPVSEMLVNTAVLCAAALAVTVLFLRGGAVKILAPVTALCGAALLALSIGRIVYIRGEYQKTGEFHVERAAGKQIEPIVQLSRTGKNTIVVMLDRATGAFLPFIMDEKPELRDVYSGFVYYPNTLSFNGYTNLGAPPIFGGYEYTPSELNRRDTVPVREKHNEALLLMPLVFSRAAYQVTVADPPYPNFSYKEDLRLYDQYPDIKAHITDGQYTDEWLKAHNMVLPSPGAVLKRNILWYSILRITPFFLREGIYQRGDWFASFTGQKLTKTLNGYAVLDYLPALTGFEPEKDNTVFIMVNNTTHDPSLMQAPDYRPALNVTNYGTSPYAKEAEYHGNAAALSRLADWFVFLKEQNTYDNTRIIITADHGAQKNYVSPMKPGLALNIDNFNPLLLVKDFDASGSLKTDNTFMTNADVPFLAFLGQIEDPVNPFTGKPISIEAKNRPLYVAPSGGIHPGDPDATRVQLNPREDFYVHDNVFDFNNWERVEQ